MNKYKKLLYIAFIVSIMLVNSCTTSNISYRNQKESICKNNECDNSLIEIHDDKNENYDLAFVEFSEMGNVFSRKKLNLVLQHIKNRKQEEYKKNNGVMVVVYAHGWKHNASGKTGDVDKFRKALKTLAQGNEKEGISGRKVIGVYIGWRGLSSTVEPFKTISYWGRKDTARQVGNGGVTELLVRLNKMLKNDGDKIANVLVISGHSFGGAVILSAMKDILIYHILNTEKVKPEQCHQTSNFKELCSGGCYKGMAFADSTVILNPAIEANELLQVKELVMEERCYAEEQPKLLHILSSDADQATTSPFKIGQYFGTSIWKKETSLPREVPEKDPSSQGSDPTKEIKLDESQLSTSTVGNFPPFRTRRYIKSSQYTPCYGGGECVDKDKSLNFAVSPYEPISIIYTDKHFIKGHSDVSNSQVLAYMTAAVIENQYKRQKMMSKIYEIRECFVKEKFKFNSCYDKFLSIYNKYQ